MANPKPPAIDRIRRRPECIDETLEVLVDAIVQAVDVNRDYEVDCLRSALEPFGGASLFNAELRLSGVSSVDDGCICGGIL